MYEFLVKMAVSIVAGLGAVFLFNWFMFEVLDVTGFKARQRAVARVFAQHDEDGDDEALIQRLKAMRRPHP